VGIPTSAGKNATRSLPPAFPRRRDRRGARPSRPGRGSSSAKLLKCGRGPARCPGCRVTIRYIYQVARANTPQVRCSDRMLAGFEDRLRPIPRVREPEPRSAGGRPVGRPRTSCCRCGMLDYLQGQYPSVKITFARRRAGRRSGRARRCSDSTSASRSALGPRPRASATAPAVQCRKTDPAWAAPCVRWRRGKCWSKSRSGKQTDLILGVRGKASSPAHLT